MEAANLNINLSLNFNQVVDLVRQLPYSEKLKLSEILEKETRQKPENDNILTILQVKKCWPKTGCYPKKMKHEKIYKRRYYCTPIPIFRFI